MKATLEFNLPEETCEHKVALEGGKWLAVCHNIDQGLRSLEKYENRDTVTVAEVRSQIREELDSYGLSFDL